MSNPEPQEPTLRDKAAQMAVALAVAAEIKARVDEIRAGVETDLKAMLDDTSVSSINLDVPGLGKVGKANIPVSQARVVVADEKAWTKWVEKNHKTEIEYVAPRVRKSFQDGHLKRAAEAADFETGEVFDPATGEVIPGLKAVAGGAPQAMSVTGIKTNYPKIIAHIANLPMNELLGLGQAAIEGEPVVVVPGDVIVGDVVIEDEDGEAA